jgi:formate dehydrogenase maturation protein FdhE
MPNRNEDMLSEPSFVKLVVELYELLGHQVTQIVRRGNYTSDLYITTSEGKNWIARCEERKEVNEIMTQRFLEQIITKQKPDQAAIITTGSFTPSVQQIVNKKERLVHLVDGNTFSQYLNRARAIAQESTNDFNPSIQQPERIDKTPELRPYSFQGSDVQTVFTEWDQKPIKISASSLAGVTTHSEPQVNLGDLEQAVAKWIAKQSYWPRELSSKHVARNFELIYAVYWVISGSAEGIWTASIGIEYTDYDVCSKCGGAGTIWDREFFGKPNYNDYGDMQRSIARGVNSDGYKYTRRTCPVCWGSKQESVTVTKWKDGARRVSASLSETILFNSAKNVKLRCGEPDRRVAKKLLASEKEKRDRLVIAPNATDTNSGTKLAEKYILQRLNEEAMKDAETLGKVRNLQVQINHFSNLLISSWLYPIYFGSYKYQNEVLQVQINGVTGEVYADPPRIVRTKRAIQNAIIVLAILGLIACCCSMLLLYLSANTH